MLISSEYSCLATAHSFQRGVEGPPRGSERRFEGKKDIICDCQSCEALRLLNQFSIWCHLEDEGVNFTIAGSLSFWCQKTWFAQRFMSTMSTKLSTEPLSELCGFQQEVETNRGLSAILSPGHLVNCSVPCWLYLPCSSRL